MFIFFYEKYTHRSLRIAGGQISKAYWKLSHGLELFTLLLEGLRELNLRF